MYQLFALFMITDPKTTVSSRRGEMIVAVLIAVVELFLRLGEVVYAPFYALFLVGPAAMLVEMYWTSGEEEGAASDREASAETEVPSPASTAHPAVWVRQWWTAAVGGSDRRCPPSLGA
jgi:hypothetical protein